jgi:hypothetical protein
MNNKRQYWLQNTLSALALIRNYTKKLTTVCRELCPVSKNNIGHHQLLMITFDDIKNFGFLLLFSTLQKKHSQVIEFFSDN